MGKAPPGINSSAGKNKGDDSTGHGNRYLARVLGEAAVGAGRTHTFLVARHRRIARRGGKNKAIVAVGRSMLVIIWHLLADPDTLPGQVHFRISGQANHTHCSSAARGKRRLNSSP